MPFLIYAFSAILKYPLSVDLKYVTNDQVVELESGGKRRFRIVSIQSTPESHDLSSSIQALSLTSSSPRLWTVTWDSSVYLSSDEPEGEKTKATVRRILCTDFCR